MRSEIAVPSMRPNSLPNRFEGTIVGGESTRHARLRAGVVELPEDLYGRLFLSFKVRRRRVRKRGPESTWRRNHERGWFDWCLRVEYSEKLQGRT